MKLLEGVVTKEDLERRGCTESCPFIGWYVYKSQVEEYVVEKNGSCFRIILGTYKGKEVEK